MGTCRRSCGAHSSGSDSRSRQSKEAVELGVTEVPTLLLLLKPDGKTWIRVLTADTLMNLGVTRAALEGALK